MQGGSYMICTKIWRLTTFETSDDCHHLATASTKEEASFLVSHQKPKPDAFAGTLLCLTSDTRVSSSASFLIT